jgi:hypothetical protein
MYRMCIVRLSLSLSLCGSRLLLDDAAGKRRHGAVGLDNVQLGRRVNGRYGEGKDEDVSLKCNAMCCAGVRGRTEDRVGDGCGKAVDDRRLSLKVLVRDVAAYVVAKSLE